LKLAVGVGLWCLPEGPIGYFPIIPPSTPQHIPETQQNRKRYAICKEVGVFIKVLCVYTEPCANARREVRGDLQDGVFVA
jgi:hypothetical protein